MLSTCATCGCGAGVAPLGVVPVLVGPLQVLMTVLPGILVALGVAILRIFSPKVFKALLKVLWRQKIAAAVAAAGVAGLVWAGQRLWVRWGPAPAREESTRSDWPVARGSMTRCGAVPGATGPTGGGLNWAWKASGEGFFSSPAVVGNRVYVASASLGVFSESGQIYCFDADSGALVWRAAPPGYRPTFSSPVVCGEYLVCGEGLHVTRDSRVVCIDLRPGREGAILWTFRTKSHVECTPAVWNGRVYVGAGDDGYYCLDLAPSPSGEPRVVWHLPGEKYPDAETSLAVADGKVYAGLGLGGKALCVLDAETGRELARLPMPYPVFGPPAIADGKLYVGMGNGDYIHTAEELRGIELNRLREAGKTPQEIEALRPTLDPAGEVRCIDLATLKTDWTCRLPETVLGAVAVAGDHLYVGARDGCLYALRRDGQLAGKWNTRAPVATSPAVTGSHVYVVNAAGMLYALDRRTLEPAWEFRIGTEPLFISSPVVARGRVYVGSQGDGFLCVGRPAEEGAALVWAGPLGGPGLAGNTDGSPVPERGVLEWQYPPDPAGKTNEPCVTAPVAVAGGSILVPLAGPGPGLACLPADAARTPAPRWRYPTANPVSLSPAVSGASVFVVDGRRGDGDRQVHCLDLATGARRWAAPVARDASGVLLATRQEVLVQTAEEALACLDLTGARQWSATVGRLDHPPSATESLVVAAVARPPALLAIDRPTGRLLWRVGLEATPTASPAVRRATVYVGTAAGLEARRLADGRPVDGWKHDGGGVSADFRLEPNTITYVNQNGEVVTVNRADGSVASRIPGAVPGLAPLVSRDVVVFAGEKGLMRVAAQGDDPKPALWLDTAPLGRLTAPMVLKDSHIYAATAGRGLVRLGKGN